MSPGWTCRLLIHLLPLAIPSLFARVRLRQGSEIVQINFPVPAQVCNHPDLFEPRHILSPLSLGGGLAVRTASLVPRARDYDPLRVSRRGLKAGRGDTDARRSFL
jgi:hypothetical protein